ncbi:hypothetical protein MJG53_018870 [Ovis ammon polii x Ovis aries]|uniref:Storkhead-box protein 1 n=2 Tax=Ovis TaxID=9935 RepID=A0A835ZIH4_SHEEP|nr:hypothetical protein JEQ12_013143 [Ovis aries]KAI4556916.1 hypothetical protein MJG53_018870 [Ovis ammon polii x Ovis aries]
MPPKMEKFLQIAPHSLAIVLGPAEGPAGQRSEAARPASPAGPQQLSRHHIGYEIFADFKAENMQHFWNKKVTAAVAETFFLGWIDEQVLLIQGKEEHLEALREGWSRRALRPPSGFHIRCLESSDGPVENCGDEKCHQEVKVTVFGDCVEWIQGPALQNDIFGTKGKQENKNSSRQDLKESHRLLPSVRFPDPVQSQKARTQPEKSCGKIMVKHILVFGS